MKIALIFLCTSLGWAQSADEYVDRGLSSSRSGNFQQAIAEYDSALKLDPQNVRALSSRGEA